MFSKGCCGKRIQPNIRELTNKDVEDVYGFSVDIIKEITKNSKGLSIYKKGDSTKHFHSFATKQIIKTPWIQKRKIDKYGNFGDYEKHNM